MPDRDREREIARLRNAMERRLHAPRLQMALIVASAGAAGFFASVAHLHLGLGRCLDPGRRSVRRRRMATVCSSRG